MVAMRYAGGPPVVSGRKSRVDGLHFLRPVWGLPGRFATPER